MGCFYYGALLASTAHAWPFLARKHILYNSSLPFPLRAPLIADDEALIVLTIALAGNGSNLLPKVSQPVLRRNSAQVQSIFTLKVLDALICRLLPVLTLYLGFWPEALGHTCPR